MNIRNVSILLIAGILSLSCGSWVRIGDLTSISNRNLDDSKNYVLISRDVEAVADAGSDAMEQAVDNLTKQYEGEFLRNAKIFVKNNGKKVKVVGDVWGIQNANTNITTIAEAEIRLEVGDSIAFKLKNKIVEGTIIGFNANQTVLVSYGRNKKISLKADEVTKINKK